MKRDAAKRLVTEPEPSPCNHTLYLDDEGNSWTTERNDCGVRVVCRHCGRFYGYFSNGDSDEPETDSHEELPDEELVVGRADYDQRREARTQRYQDRAERARSESAATFERASQMADVIPLGQPILVGHHSEKRDRRYRKRIQDTFRRGTELHSKASYYDEKAKAAENSRAISSDDPEAVIKLREKLDDLEAHQARMKKVNAAWRAAKRPMPDDIDAWSEIADRLGVELDELGPIRVDAAKRFGWCKDKTPYPAYALSNNNAEIRRVKERIRSFRESHGRETSETDHGFCCLVENVEDNRVQLVFPGKPPKETRAILKSNGFRWAPSVEAWQRLLNPAGVSAANRVVEQLQKQEVSS